MSILYLDLIIMSFSLDGTSESSGSSENAGEPILVYSPSTETIEYLTTTVSGYRIPGEIVKKFWQAR